MNISIPQLHISIVSFNTPIDDMQNIISCIKKSKNISILTTIVDNAQDKNIKSLAKNANINYIDNMKNVGYGSAHNKAIRISIDKNIPYHLVVNADVSFGMNVLRSIYDYMESHTSVGLVLPRVFYPHGNEQFLAKFLPSPISLVLGRIFKSSSIIINPTPIKPTNIPLLSGCFMFMRTNSLKDVGLFDERFFLYFEDFDLSRRIHEKYETIFLPNASIQHRWGNASKKISRALLLHLQSAFQYFNKWGWFETRRKKINEKCRKDLQN